MALPRPSFRSPALTLRLPMVLLTLAGCGRVASTSKVSENEDTVTVPPPLEDNKWRQIAYVHQGELYHLNFSEPATPLITRLTTMETAPSPTAQWSPSGHQLVWGTATDTDQTVLTMKGEDIHSETFSLPEGHDATPPASFWLGDEEVHVRVGSPDDQMYFRSQIGAGEPGPLGRITSWDLPWSPSGAAGYVTYEDDESFLFHRLGREELSLPPGVGYYMSPSGTQLALFSVEETDFVGEIQINTDLFFIEDSGDEPPLPANDPSEPTLANTPILQPPKWSLDGNMIGIARHLGALSLDRSESWTQLFFSEERILNVNASQSSITGWGGLNDSWGFAPNGDVYWTHILASEESEGWTWSLHRVPADRVFIGASLNESIFEGLGIPLGLVPASDGSAFFAHTWDQVAGSYDLLALTMSENGEATIRATLLTAFDPGEDRNILHPQPSGASVLITLGDCALSSCSDSWLEAATPGTHHGYTLWSQNGDIYEKVISGDGAARWTPDGEGLLIRRSSALYFLSLSAPDRLYPLTELDRFQLLIPDAWPE